VLKFIPIMSSSQTRVTFVDSDSSDAHSPPFQVCRRRKQKKRGKSSAKSSSSTQNGSQFPRNLNETPRSPVSLESDFDCSPESEEKRSSIIWSLVLDGVTVTLWVTRECLRSVWDLFGGAKKWKRKSEELEAQLEELHAMQHRRHKHLDEKKQIERMLNDRENDLESMNAEVHYKNQEIEKQKQQVEHWKRQFCCLKEAMSELQAERDNDIQSSQKHKRKSRKGRAQERKEATEDHAAEIAGLKETIALVEQAAEERTERFELLERAFLVKLDEMAEIEEARNNELVNVEEERDMLRKDFWEVCKMLKSEQAAAVASDQKKKDLELQVAEFAQVKREKAHLEDRLDWMSSVTSVTSIGRSISSSCRFDDSFDGRSSAGTNLRVTSPMGSSMCVSLGARSMPARLFEEEGTLFGDAVIHNSEDDVHGGHDHMHISDVDGVTSEATWEVVPIVKKDVGSGDCDCGDFGDTGRNVGKDDISKSSSSSATRLPSFLRTLAAEMRARARGSNAYWKLMSTHNGNLAWMRGSLSVLILLLLYVFRRERKNGLMKYVKVIIATNAFAKLLGQ